MSDFGLKCSSMSLVYSRPSKAIQGETRFFNGLSEGRESPPGGMRVAQLPTESLENNPEFIGLGENYSWRISSV